jgi:hypothetical protein
MISSSTRTSDSDSASWSRLAAISGWLKMSFALQLGEAVGQGLLGAVVDGDGVVDLAGQAEDGAEGIWAICSRRRTRSASSGVAIATVSTPSMT